MDLTTAQDLVIEDHDNTWDCDDCEGSSDALAHVCDVLRLPGTEPIAGSYPFQPTGDDLLDTAYLTVLRDAAEPTILGLPIR